MKPRTAAALFAIFSITALALVAGCSKQPSTSPLLGGLVGTPGPDSGGSGGSGGPGDSVPPPPSPPPPPAPMVPIRFAGSDSAFAGTTAQLSWIIGNESSASFRVDWTLTCALSWPGFPQHGSITVPGDSVAWLDTRVEVPSDAATGMVEFQITVTRANGEPPASATGWLRVVSTAPPPPPPPPPVLPVVYLGADSVHAGETVTQQWQLTNESAAPFTMSWRLESHSPWAGLPKTGLVQLSGSGSTVLITTAAVPDTAAAGYRWLRLTVTRPDGLPDASVDGPFYIRP